ncbi:MAG: glycosyltransferase [Nitrospirota bacterium]
MKIHVTFSGLAAGNIGDEAMMQGFLSLHPLPEGTTIEVWDAASKAISQLPPSYRYINYADTDACNTASLAADYVLIVGATIVTEMHGLEWPLRILGSKYALCHARGVPIHAVGIGVDRLHSTGAIQLFNTGFLPFDSWTVRAAQSRKNLLAIGVEPGRCLAAADLAWLTPTHGVDTQWAQKYLSSLGVKDGPPVLGVNIVNENWKDNDTIKTETAAALDWAAGELNWQIVFFCNETREGEFFDKEAALKTASFMKHRPIIVPNTYFTPEQMIALLSCCKLTISWRYHFTVFSALAGALALPVIRGGKLAELASELNGLNLGTPETLTSKKIIESITYAADNENNFRALKYRQDASVDALRQRSMFNSYFINKLSPGNVRLKAESLVPALLELTRYKETLVSPLMTTKEYIVTVIISSYMSEEFIAECLDGLREQSIWRSIEVIVIDAASPQNEQGIVTGFQKDNPNLTYVKTAEKINIYAAWNIGLRLARGRYVTVLSTNDRLAADALELMARTLDSRPDIALVYGDSYMTETPHESFERHTGAPSMVWPEYDYEDLLKHCRIGPHPMWRKSVSDRIGQFDETYTANGDQEYWLRMGERFEFLHIPKFTGLYWHNPQSLSQSGGIQETHRAHSLYQKRYINNLRLTVTGSDRPLYIWGTDRLALITNHMLVNLGVPVSGFISNNPETTFATAPVFKFDDIITRTATNRPFIIIAAEGGHKSLLKAAGYVERKDFWTNIYELSWIWDLHNPI